MLALPTEFPFIFFTDVEVDFDSHIHIDKALGTFLGPLLTLDGIISV